MSKAVQNEEIGGLMKEFVEQTVNFYDGLKTEPVCRPVPQGTLEYLERCPIPKQGRPLREVYSEMLRMIYSNTLLPQHPQSFSCIPSTASMLSWMGDVMTNAYNPHASCQINAPAADLVEKLIREDPAWEMISPAQLGIVNFRYVGDRTEPGADLDHINQEISREITASGFAQIFTTELHGKKVLRMCTIHPETSERDILETIERLKKSQAIAAFRCRPSLAGGNGF